MLKVYLDITGPWRNMRGQEEEEQGCCPIFGGDNPEELRQAFLTEMLKHFTNTPRLRLTKEGEAGLTIMKMAIAFEDSCGQICEAPDKKTRGKDGERVAKWNAKKARQTVAANFREFAKSTSDQQTKDLFKPCKVAKQPCTEMAIKGYQPATSCLPVDGKLGAFSKTSIARCMLAMIYWEISNSKGSTA